MCWQEVCDAERRDPSAPVENLVAAATVSKARHVSAACATFPAPPALAIDTRLSTRDSSHNAHFRGTPTSLGGISGRASAHKSYPIRDLWFCTPVRKSVNFPTSTLRAATATMLIPKADRKKIHEVFSTMRGIPECELEESLQENYRVRVSLTIVW